MNDSRIWQIKAEQEDSKAKAEELFAELRPGSSNYFRVRELLAAINTALQTVAVLERCESALDFGPQCTLRGDHDGNHQAGGREWDDTYRDQMSARYARMIDGRD